jgi:uncharacterized protein YndB with AHSA1/START domain
MNTQTNETLCVVVERDMPCPPEKLWRALTQPHLIQEWLMKNDFKPAVDHQFQFRMDPQGGWNGIIDCKVLSVEPNKTLSYTWTTMGMGTLVTFTLTPSSSGTHLRVEQSGFSAAHPQAYNGAKYGWQSFLAKLEQMVARTD